MDWGHAGWAVGAGTAALLLSLATPALADPALSEVEVKPDEGTASRMGVAGVALAASAEGFALGAQFDLSYVSLRGTFGYAPLLLAVDADPGSDDVGKYKFLNTTQTGGDLLVFVWANDKARLGPMLGYRYNGVLGHGAALGGQGEAYLNDYFALVGMITYAYYPEGTERARREFKHGEERKFDFNFPFGAGFQGGFGGGVKLDF